MLRKDILSPVQYSSQEYKHQSNHQETLGKHKVRHIQLKEGEGKLYSFKNANVMHDKESCGMFQIKES